MLPWLEPFGYTFIQSMEHQIGKPLFIDNYFTLGIWFIQLYFRMFFNKVILASKNVYRNKRANDKKRFQSLQLAMLQLM